jgi:hypothetical protein
LAAVAIIIRGLSYRQDWSFILWRTRFRHTLQQSEKSRGIKVKRAILSGMALKVSLTIYLSAS